MSNLLDEKKVGPSTKMYVLAWKDVNGGIHVDEEIYQHFFPMYKLKGTHREISKIIQRLEEVKSIIVEILNQQNPSG